MTKARRTIGRGVVLGFLLVLGLSCSSESDPHAGHDHSENEEGGQAGEEEHEEGEVHLAPEKLEALDLKTVAIRSGSLEGAVDLPAEVRWNADKLVHVSPRVRGVVTKVEKTLGDAVSEGDLLCVLDSREMGEAKMEFLSDLGKFAVAEADFARSKAVYENTKTLLGILDKSPTPEAALSEAAELAVGDNKNKLLTTYTRMRVNQRNFERTDALLAKKIASEVDHLEAQGAYDISRADYLSTREEITFDLELKFLRAERNFALSRTELNNSERALHILGARDEDIESLRRAATGPDVEISRNEIRSSLDGVIVERHLTGGEFVSSESQLYTVADLSEVWVIGQVFERDLRTVRVGLKASVRLDAFPGETFEGSVAYLGSELDRTTRSVEARVVLPNPGARFRPGMFGSVTVFTEHDHTGPAHKPALLVPLSALQREGSKYVVFVQEEPGEFREVAVRVLARSKELAEVTGELEEGALVVTGETFVLKSEAGKETMGGGHSH